jgi:phosphoribosyl 1,2-cyclic phosphodiesterase
VRVSVLASGSSGNAVVIEARETRVLVDCGLSLRQLEHRLRLVGLGIADLDGVVVTHEHTDHTVGLATLLRRRRLPVMASTGTWTALEMPTSVEFEPLTSGQEVHVGSLRLLPVGTSHDANEPLAVVATEGSAKVGLVTDTGVVTELLLERLDGCRALFLETNHDPDLLRWGPYPWPLKQRIASRTGHLSNQQAQSAVERLAHAGLAAVVGMHLSRENNRPELAARELESPLRGSPVRVLTARQDEPIVVDLPEDPCRSGQLGLFPAASR